MNETKLYRIIKELSNPTKFKIIQLTQNKALNITELSRKVKIAYNKCSNYCTQLTKHNLVEKIKNKKEVYIKSRINLKKLYECLHNSNSSKK